MRFFIFILASILFFGLAGCSSLSQKKFAIDQQLPPHKILFVKERWHTSLILEAKPLLAVMPELKAELAAHPFVRVGWGDGDFFTGKNKSNLSATRALFVSRYSAMQVLDYDEWPIDEFEENTRATLMLTDLGLQNLMQFIRGSFVFDEAGALKPLPAFTQNTGSFFVARAHYSVFNNCNSWSVDALKAAGLPMAFHLTPSGVLSDAKKIAHLQYCNTQASLQKTNCNLRAP